MSPNDGRSLESLILNKLLAVDYQPVTPGVLARQMQLSREQGDEFLETLTQLSEPGRAPPAKNGSIKTSSPPGAANPIAQP